MKTRIYIAVILLAAGIIGGVIGVRYFLDEATAPQMSNPNSEQSGDKQLSEDTKHSIPLDEILSGGVGKDGIPSIDNPVFVNPSEADNFLNAASVGLGLEHNSVTRFYPYRVLVWHEIVNDTAGDEPILVTYCPLCGTGIVFERTVDGESVEFGVSGKLYKSNLLMYDRRSDSQNESYWSQILGEAVVGPRTGTDLDVIPANTVQYGEWKENHPNTEVLSQETGHNRPYGENPYGDYSENNRVSFGASFNDDRLHPKAPILGINVKDTYKAYPKDQIRNDTINDTVGGEQIQITKKVDGSIQFTNKSDGSEIAPINSFWFAWLSVHPDTLLYNENSN